MNPMQQAVTTLQQELEALDQRRGEIARAIETLRPFVGGAPVPRRAGQKVRKEGPTGGGHGRGGDAILSALREKSPQSPRELAARLKWNTGRVGYSVRQLRAAKKVECTGLTNDRQVHLLPRPRVAAKEEP